MTGETKLGIRLRWTLRVACIANLVAFVVMVRGEGSAGNASDDRVDFWTLKEEGCACPKNSASLGNTTLSCACCDPENSGCLCQKISNTNVHDRCTQCGLEMYCGKMCNMTIDMSQLKAKHGAIYSPPASGSVFCSYYIVANRDTRIKLLLYRIQGIGRFDPQLKRCVGGYLQVIDGIRALKGNSSAVHVFCAADSRFERPVTIFKTRAMAVIQYWTEVSAHPRFMLQYEFEDKSEIETYQLGGSPIPNSECDWIYRQINCSDSEAPCEFSSPGYPGLYPNFQHCRYFFRSMDPALQIRVQFKAFDFPVGDCDTHYANIFDGAYSSRTDPPLQTLCGAPKPEDLIFFSTGPSMVIEIITGSLSPPYTYTGFHGTIIFGNGPPDATIGNRMAGTFCDWTFYSNTTPSASFSTPIDWYPKDTVCTFTFIPVLSVERSIISFQSYFLESDLCGTYVTLTEMDDSGKPSHQLKKFCGPLSKYSQADSRSLEEYASNPGKILKLTFASEQGNLILGEVSEWIAGSFMFHNDRLHGTKKLNTVCDLIFNQRDHQDTGIITAPKFDNILNEQMRISPAPTDCHVEFEVKPLHTVDLTLKHASLLRPGEEMMPGICSTECDRTGCRCVLDDPEMHSMEEIFHIVIESTSRPVTEISCFCGDVTDALPITISVMDGAIFRFHRPIQPQTESHFYDFQIDYKFQELSYECSKPSHKRSYGILQIHSKQNTSAHSIHFIQCTWNIDVASQHLISIDARLEDQGKGASKPKTSRPCVEKNSVKLFTAASPRSRDKGIEFCTNTAVTINSSKLMVRLTATGRLLKHRILWKEVTLDGNKWKEVTTGNCAETVYCGTTNPVFVLLTIVWIFRPQIS